MGFSLRKKAILYIILMALLFSSVSVLVSQKIINDLVNDHYTSRATEIANTVAVYLDASDVLAVREAILEIYRSLDEKDIVNSEYWGEPEFYEYLSKFDPVAEMPEYQHVMEQLRLVQDQNDVDCLYINYADPVSVAFLYLVDAAEEDACPPGCVDQYDMDNEVNQQSLNHPELGMPAYITNTEAYGYLVSVSVPIMYNNEFVAFSSVDIEMNSIRAKQRTITLAMVGLLFILAVVVCVVGYIIVNRSVVQPIRKLSDTAANYIKEESESGTRHGFADLNIKSSDEIGTLADSMKQMESDINDYYTNLLAAKQEIVTTREEASRMGEIANRDALTGVRNKRAYDHMLEDINKEIEAGGAVFGIAMVDLNYLKTINDQYGHDKGNIAIKKLCRLICVIFSHSPVFRIGGDEFAIILKNGDYENIQELVEKFESELVRSKDDPELPPWEQTSAALGYTFYRPDEDADADAVFRRADSLMYEHKREMKKA